MMETQDIQDETEDNGLEPIARALLVETLAPLRGMGSARLISAKTAADLEWVALVEGYVRRAVSPLGQELAENISPMPSQKLAERRRDEICECMALTAEDLEIPLRGLQDARRALSMAIRDGMLLGEDLEAVARNCDVASRTRRFFKHRAELAPKLAAIGMLVDPCRELRDALDIAIEPGGRLADSASPDLRRLRRAVQNHTDRIKARVEKLLRSESIEAMLQDDFFTVRDDRYVLPIRVSAKRQIDGIVHGYSQSGQTAFIEPQELIELNNHLRWAQREVEEEERRILQRLTALVKQYTPVLTANDEYLAYLDLIAASAIQSAVMDAVYFDFADDIDLKRARHPLLFLKLKNEDGTNDTVPNDIRLKKNALVISGPNTGGKTVLVKTMGLAALMARCGLPLCVDEDSRVPFYQEVFTDIGDEQSIERDLSTFSAHMVNINSFLPHCAPGVLVLLDELFSGTDPEQGSVLGVALLERLADYAASVMVTTHLEGLKTLAIEDDRFANASMGFDIDTLEPTYQVTLGLPGSSYALRIASRLDFPEDIINRATVLLEREGGLGLDKILSRLEEQVSDLKKQERHYEAMRVDAEKLKRRYEKKLREITKKERDLVSEDARKLKEQLVEVRTLLHAKLKELSASDQTVTRKDVDRIRADVKAAEKAVDMVRDQSAPVRVEASGRVPVAKAELAEGLEVYVARFKRKGVIATYSKGDTQAAVQVGVMKASVSIDELYYPSESVRKEHVSAREKSPAPVSTDSPVMQTSGNTVDLRGMRVDEAVERVEIFLDGMFLAGDTVAFIIHGHGTGALKRAVRDYLAGSRYVRDYRRGDRTEGGDGVSVAFLAEQV